MVGKARMASVCESASVSSLVEGEFVEESCRAVAAGSMVLLLGIVLLGRGTK